MTAEIEVLPLEEINPDEVVAATPTDSYPSLYAFNDGTFLEDEYNQIRYEIEREDGSSYYYYQTITAEHLDGVFNLEGDLAENSGWVELNLDATFNCNVEVYAYFHLLDAETKAVYFYDLYVLAVDDMETFPEITVEIAREAAGTDYTRTYQWEYIQLTEEMFNDLTQVDFTTPGLYVAEITFEGETHELYITVYDPEVCNIEELYPLDVSQSLGFLSNVSIEEEMELILDDTYFAARYYTPVNGSHEALIPASEITIDYDAIDLDYIGRQLLPFEYAGYTGYFIVQIMSATYGTPILGVYEYEVVDEYEPEASYTMEIVLFENGIAYSYDLCNTDNGYANYEIDGDLIYIDVNGIGLYSIFVIDEENKTISDYVIDEEATPDKVYAGVINDRDALIHLYGDIVAIYVVIPPVEEGGEELLIPMMLFKATIDEETNSIQISFASILLIEAEDEETVGSFRLISNLNVIMPASSLK